MIRWITASLGTAPFEAAVAEPGVTVVDARELVDRSGNLAGAVRALIDEGVQRLQGGGRVVVACDYGISRSNAVAAGILSVLQDVSLDAAIRQVVAATGETAMKLDVIGAVRDALSPAPSVPPVPVVSSPPAGAMPDRTRRLGGRRVLITGAATFLGAGLAATLRPRHHVTGTGTVDCSRDAVGLHLLARERATDVVVHLAAPHVYTSNEAMGTRIAMLRTVIDVCVATGSLLIVPGDWEVFSGYRTAGLLVDESVPVNPGSTYGQGLALCEQLLREARRREGLTYLLLRLATVYGPGGERPHVISNFARKARLGEPAVLHRFRNGLSALDLLHVDDVHAAIAAAIAAGETGVLHLGSGVARTTLEIAEDIGVAGGAIYRDVDRDATNIVMDATRATERLGWRPSVAWEDGLRQVLGELALRASP